MGKKLGGKNWAKKLGEKLGKKWDKKFCEKLGKKFGKNNKM